MVYVGLVHFKRPVIYWGQRLIDPWSREQASFCNHASLHAHVDELAADVDKGCLIFTGRNIQDL